MVQIIPMRQAPSLAQALGAGFGQGLSEGMDSAIKDMMERKVNDRKTRSLFHALGPELQQQLGLTEQDLDKFSGIDPNTFMSVLNVKLQQGNQANLASSQMESPVSGGRPTEAFQGIPQETRARTLTAGTPPMLAQEDMPAVEETQPRQSKEPQLQMLKQRETSGFETLPYAQQKQQLTDYWNEKILRAPASERKEYLNAKKQELKYLQEEEKIRQQTRSTEIKNKLAEKQLRELPHEVSTQLTKMQEAATAADKSIQGIEAADTLLKAGAQFPEAVTRINQILPGTRIAEFANGLAANPLSVALETAKVQQFGGARSIFGSRMAVAEFDRYAKKLQSVTDPALSNEIKSILLKQAAMQDKFAYEGLNKAIKEDRDAPSDVILRKGKKYADQMAVSNSQKTKKQLDGILKEWQVKEQKFKPGFTSKNINDFKNIPEGHSVRTPSGEILTMKNGKLIKE